MKKKNEKKEKNASAVKEMAKTIAFLDAKHKKKAKKPRTN